jgi:hypothetical protein
VCVFAVFSLGFAVVEVVHCSIAHIAQITTNATQKWTTSREENAEYNFCTNTQHTFELTAHYWTPKERRSCNLKHNSFKLQHNKNLSLTKLAIIVLK